MTSFRPYSWVGDLNLYAGLFLTPVVAIFAVSVPVINHFAARGPGAETRREIANVAVPAGVELLDGRERIARLRPVLDSLGVAGEVGFVRYAAREGRLIVPVSTPGRESVVELNLREKSAVVSYRNAGPGAASVYLHKAPGPHLANIRGNWGWMRAWGVFADATVYLTLLTTATGIWLWIAIRAGRKPGLVWLIAGMAVFTGVIYAMAA
jgi:hypothetical protein